MAENQHTAFRGLFDMFAEMNRMREHWTDADQAGDRGPSAWVPAVDIYASGDDLVVRCELAGIPKSDVEVSLSDGQLWISRASGAIRRRTRRTTCASAGTGPSGGSSRSPGSVEGRHITATVEDGLLEVVVAGACRARHEQIEIGGADNGDVSVDVKR